MRTTAKKITNHQACQRAPKGEYSLIYIRYVFVIIFLRQFRDKNKIATTQKSKRVVRHYAWLRYSRDRKLQMCKYCRIRFHSEANKYRHELSPHHKMMEAAYKSRRSAATSEKRKEKEESPIPKEVKHTPKPELEKPIPATVQGRVMVWKNRFPWLSYKRSEQRHNYAWCKLCEVSIFLPSSKYASKHQRSSRHVRLRFERKRAAQQPGIKMDTGSSASSAALATGEAKQKAAMSELQEKYSWLEPDADENHCHCNVCDVRLPIKVFYLRQHDGSRRHNEQVERLREATTAAVAPTPSTVANADNEESDGAISVK